MIGVELEAQRSHPDALARGMMSAIAGDTTPGAIAAMRIVAEWIILGGNRLSGGKWLR